MTPLRARRPSVSPVPARVCLITPGHLASTPRVLKEADSLAAAGFETHVVSGRHFAPVDPLDDAVLAEARWRSTRVDFSPGHPGVFRRKLLRRLARRFLPVAPTVKLAARALHAETFRLASAAAALRADFYLGHCLAGLPAAAFAARETGTAYGFDAEDFHDAETVETETNATARTSARVLQRALLPGCAHLTAASPLIARAVGEAYAATPEVLLNVFPRSHAPAQPFTPPPISAARPARIYWFSQTVGPGRGLETIVSVLARMQTPTQLCLRGFSSTAYRAELSAHATRTGLRMPIEFLDPGPAAEMARLASTADIGLSIEETTPRNRDLCLTNKVFIYLLAGIPQLLSMTSAQRLLAPELDDAAVLSDINDAPGTARRLDEFFASPQHLASARATATHLAHERFCWDVEQHRFLNSVRAALALAKN